MPRPLINPDRITKRVLVRAIIGALVSILAAWGIDLNLNETQQGALADALLVIVPILFTLAGSLWGSKDATKVVTPIPTAKDDAIEQRTGVAPVAPRDLQGRELRPVDHGQLGGYPPTRAARPEERPRRQPPPTSFP